MGIIKKKDILNRQKQIVGDEKKKPEQIVGDEKEPIDELVDGDGSAIEGGTHNYAANSEIRTAPGQTTDDYADSAIQPNNYFYGIYGSPYSRGSSHLTAESTKRAMDKIKNILNESK
jgi:hypothetical protein